MPNINVEISEELLKAIRLYCAETGQTQKDVVVETLTTAFAVTKGTGYFNGTFGKSKVQVQGKGESVRDGGVVSETQGVRTGRKARSTSDDGAALPETEKPAARAADVFPSTSLIPNEKCTLCGAGVYLTRGSDAGGPKWKCVGPRTHTMSPREPKNAER